MGQVKFCQPTDVTWGPDGSIYVSDGYGKSHIDKYSKDVNLFFFFSSRRRHTRFDWDWSSDVCSSDLKLAAYYVLLGLAAWLLIRFVPSIPQLLARFREVSLLETVASRNRLVEEATAAAGTLSQGQWALVTFLSMLTALVLVLPVSWVYMLTKQRSGYDQSVVQTVIILPMTVAATVILVQNSLALAFTLAPIVAAGRFRNTLTATKDAGYIFLT